MALSSVVLMILAATAPADAWEGVFSTDALAGYLHPGSPRILLVSAGPNRKEVELATAALADVLSHLQSVQLALGGKSYAVRDELSDGSILESVKQLPVDVVWIVRVFAGEPFPMVVVTIYDREGSVLDAFTTTANNPLAAANIEDRVDLPLETVASVMDATAKDQERRFAEFRANHIRVGVKVADFFVVGLGYSGSDADITLYRGSYEEPLSGADLYEHLRRDDLATHYRIWQGTRIGLALTGVTLVAAGLLVIRSRPDDCDNLLFYQKPACEERIGPDRNAKLSRGIALAGIGVIAGIVAAFLDPHPMNEYERFEAAALYNVRLAEELQIPLPEEVDLRPHLPRVKTLLGVYQVDDTRGAGLQMRVSF